MVSFTLKSLAVLTGLTGVFASCNKNGLLLPTAKRIQGSWKFEKVKLAKNFSLAREDISSDFSSLVLHFGKDNVLTREDVSTSQTWQGDWRVNSHWGYNSENPQAVEILVGSIPSLSTEGTSIMLWENLCISSKKITCTEFRDGGTYYYTLRKVP